MRGVVSGKDSAGPVDIECVDTALRQAFGKIERWDYVSDGGTFPSGTNVAQFAYFQSEDGRGWATLEIGDVKVGTRLAHSFTGIGAQIPEEDFTPAFRAMDRASAILQSTCKLDLKGMRLRAVGQEVKALEHRNARGN